MADVSHNTVANTKPIVAAEHKTKLNCKLFDWIRDHCISLCTPQRSFSKFLWKLVACWYTKRFSKVRTCTSASVSLWSPVSSSKGRVILCSPNTTNTNRPHPMHLEQRQHKAIAKAVIHSPHETARHDVDAWMLAKSLWSCWIICWVWTERWIGKDLTKGVLKHIQNAHTWYKKVVTPCSSLQMHFFREVPICAWVESYLNIFTKYQRRCELYA